MAKLLFVFCVVLAVSMAFAYETEAEEKEKAELAVKNCVRSINNIIAGLSQKYNSIVEPSKDEKFRDLASEYYEKATEMLNNLNAHVRNSKEKIRMSVVLETFGNDIMCSDDIALKIYFASYYANEGLNRLAKSAGQE